MHTSLTSDSVSRRTKRFNSDVLLIVIFLKLLLQRYHFLSKRTPFLQKNFQKHN